MRERVGRLASALLLASAFVLSGALAYAQGSATSSLSGVAVDTSGAIIPGATVVAKNDATGATFETVTTSQGTFSLPALPSGKYTVTVSLAGFKTVVLSDVVLETAVPAIVKATLEVGALEETIVVTGGSEIVQTQTSAVATTLNVTSVSNIPMASRNVLDIVTLLPGVSTPGGSRQSSVAGLPRGMINITLDGVNVQDNTLRSTDGFFTIVQPRLDAVEEVTVSTAGQGSDSAGQGAVQIRFITRSGTNEFRGSAYWYGRRGRWNANTWFNERDKLQRPAGEQNQPGVRAGGPIVIPGIWNGHNKGFFFVNYEEFRQPTQLQRTRTTLHPTAQAGVFRYNVAGGVREVNLLALAAARGQTATLDPTVAKLLTDIQAATRTTGAVLEQPNPLFRQYRYLVDQRAKNRYPTVSVDLNVTDRHRVKTTLNWHTFLSVPDTLNNRDPWFPGFPITATQTSERISLTGSLRSTLTPTLVNEFRTGAAGAPVQFFKELSPSMWGGSGGVADQAGFHLSLGLGLTNAGNAPTPSSRNASNWVVEDTMNWIRGGHSMGFGGSFTEVNLWLKNQTLVPTVNFGIVTGDPADAMFTTASFPGASSTDLTNARNLYALLTGRVSAINGNIGLNEETGEYEYLALRVQRARMRQAGFFFQDSWRASKNLTLNLGLRYELQFPFTARNDVYSYATLESAWGVSGLASGCKASEPSPASCNLFKPGTMPGIKPEFIEFKQGVHTFNTDWNNLAPSVGLNWTPSVDGGFLGRLLGRPGDTAVRAGFNRSFNREGMSNFTGRIDDNPGIIITANRDATLGNLGTAPLLFRDRGLLGPPAFAKTRTFPMTDYQITQGLGMFDPDLQVPWADTWTVGVQRAITRTMAVEVRYVGTRSRDLWTNYNYNEVNIVENGFLGEFRNAQRNLQANIAAGRGSTFAYFGQGTGTVPLPIYLAYFSGVSSALAGDAARYTSTLFRSTNFTNALALYNPNPYAPASSNSTTGLFGTAARRANALAAGLPANFFLANPDLLGGVNVTGNGGYTNYNSMEVELRRRLSQGLQFQASYTFAHTWLSAYTSHRKPWFEVRDAGSPGEVAHALKAFWDYELPFGRGRRFFRNAGGVLDRIVGGWQVHGSLRVQSGMLIDFGNVRMVGFTAKDLWKMYQLRIDDNQRAWVLPKDVIDNTVKAYSVSATSTTGYGALGPPEGRYFAPANGPSCIEEAPGFGDCGSRSLLVRGPMFKMLDLSILKQVRLKGRTTVEFRVEALDVLDWVNFTPVAGLGSNPNSYEVTGLAGDVTRRMIQLIARFSW